MGLAGGADHHDMVGAVPRRHPHPPDIVFEPSRGDLGRNRLDRFWVDVSEVFGGGERNALFERFGNVGIMITARLVVSRLFPPNPAAALGDVVFKVFEDFFDVEFSALV